MKKNILLLLLLVCSFVNCSKANSIDLIQYISSEKLITFFEGVKVSYNDERSNTKAIKLKWIESIDSEGVETIIRGGLPVNALDRIEQNLILSIYKTKGNTLISTPMRIKNDEKKYSRAIEIVNKFLLINKKYGLVNIDGFVDSNLIIFVSDTMQIVVFSNDGKSPKIPDEYKSCYSKLIQKNWYTIKCK